MNLRQRWSSIVDSRVDKGKGKPYTCVFVQPLWSGAHHRYFFFLPSMLLDFVMFPWPHQIEKKKKLCCWGALWSTSSPTGDALASLSVPFLSFEACQPGFWMSMSQQSGLSFAALGCSNEPCGASGGRAGECLRDTAQRGAFICLLNVM